MTGLTPTGTGIFRAPKADREHWQNRKTADISTAYWNSSSLFSCGSFLVNPVRLKLIISRTQEIKLESKLRPSLIANLLILKSRC
jgi:hypothetical protein